ncbi:MAG TPA: ABC transporter permease, partial [Casimicrobiaceae bacterium]|nr:ABC transporter permease [Casimicrobiaceae bacterium]
MAREESPLRRIAADFAADPLAVAGLALLAIILVAAFAAPLV